MHCFLPTDSGCRHSAIADLFSLCPLIWYCGKLTYCIAGKFGGELNLVVLVVGVETAKLKSANIISYVTHNDVMHAVVLLVLSGAPLRGCTCI